MPPSVFLRHWIPAFAGMTVRRVVVLESVIPAQAGIHAAERFFTPLDSRFRGNDGAEGFAGLLLRTF
jgi:hypothetical protein